MPSGTIGSATGANNVTGVAADYTSIANWEAAIDGNNQTGTVIYIGGAIDTSALTLNAAYSGMLLTAHADAYVNAPTYAAATSRARVEVASAQAMDVASNGWTIEKIAIRTTGGSDDGVRFSGTSGTIRRCYVEGTNIGIRNYVGGTVNVHNCAVVCQYNTGSCVLNHVGTAVISHHVSAVGTGGGALFWAIGGATQDVYACIAQSSGTCFSTGGGAGDYNVSEDATAPGSASTKYARSTSGWFTNTSAGSEDLSLVAGKQGWWASNKDAIDQTGWPSDVGTDIVGTTRAAPIDPGVWQTPAAGGGTTRGMPFGTRSTAFNGGRTFAGVLR